MSALRELLEQLLDRRNLSEAQAAELLVALTDPTLSPALGGALLAGLRAKGVTADEVRGFAKTMRRLARRPILPDGGPLVDMVGTGGDGSGSFNLSTGAALLVAAMGIRVGIDTLRGANVSAIHYSKNMAFTDFTTCSMVMSELKLIDLDPRLDLSNTDYRNEGHAIRQPRNVLDLNRRMDAWLDRYLKPEVSR